MASCENCLHYEVCKPMGLAMRNAMKAGSLTEGVEHNCYIKCFKPIADVVEVKHGEWIVIGKTVGWSNILQCSVCGKVRKGVGKSAFCRDCGAKMDVSKKEITTERKDT